MSKGTISDEHSARIPNGPKACAIDLGDNHQDYYLIKKKFDKKGSVPANFT